jgi:hypothetical protein
MVLLYQLPILSCGTDNDGRIRKDGDKPTEHLFPRQDPISGLDGWISFHRLGLQFFDGSQLGWITACLV